MELGGKSALLVFDDADVEKAVEWCMVSLPAFVSLFVLRPKDMALPCHMQACFAFLWSEAWPVSGLAQDCRASQTDKVGSRKYTMLRHRVTKGLDRTLGSM